MRNYYTALPIWFLIGVCLASGLWAGFPKPYIKERREIERLCAIARSNDNRRGALSELQGIIEDSNRPKSIRSYAILQLGKLGLQEMEDFFLNFAAHRVHGEPEGEEGLRAQAYLAYSMIRVANEEDFERKLDLLVDQLNAQYAGRNQALVMSWAAQELCSLGQVDRMDLIRHTISRVEGTTREQVYIALCEHKARIISNHEDRLEALMTALEQEDPWPDQSLLHFWAIEEIGRLGTKSAGKALLDHARNVRDPSSLTARNEYRKVIEELRRMGWSQDELDSAGLYE